MTTEVTMKLEDAKALVTGGSRGLGRALGEALARRGAEVILVARDEGPLEEVVRALQREGLRAHALTADIGAPESASMIAGAAAAMVGPLDVLVHNASTLGPTPLALLADTSDQDFERALAVNLLGAFRLSRAVVGSMVQRGRGLLLHVSSDAAVEAYPSWGAYGASKAALDHLARTWAAELEGSGVRAIAVDPGEMDTAMHAAAIPDTDPATLARPSEVAARLVRLMEREALAPSGARVVAAEVTP
jgi:NAD(P)-dependent dehydrogenase (short-subunit alcohol dehydrogenase family)